jgi:tetratricopeptide (TPR) repeat protein
VKKAIASLENDIELDTEITEIKFYKMAIPFAQNIIFAENTMLPDTEICGIWDDKTKSLLAQAEVALKKAIELKLAKINKNSDINSNWLDKEWLAGIWSNLGTIYSYQGKYKKAIDTYNKAIELNPGYIEVWMDKGHALLSEKRLTEAIDAFDKAIKIDPRNAKAWSGKGYTFKEMGKIYLKDAIHAFDKAIEFDPFYFIAWSGKGNVLFEIGNYDEAIKVCDKALEINPFDLKMYRNKSNSLLRLNNYEEAIKTSDRAIELNFQYASSWFKEYEKLYVRGKYDEAIRAYDKGLELVVENSTIHNIKGDAAFNSALRYPTRLWDALIAYNIAIILNPLDIYSCCCKSMVLYTLGFVNESKKTYLRANRLAILSATPYQYVEILPFETLLLEIDFWSLSIPEPNGPDLNDLITSDNNNYPNAYSNHFSSLYYTTYR